MNKLYRLFLPLIFAPIGILAMTTQPQRYTRKAKTSLMNGSTQKKQAPKNRATVLVQTKRLNDLYRVHIAKQLHDRLAKQLHDRRRFEKAFSLEWYALAILYQETFESCSPEQLTANATLKDLYNRSTLAFDDVYSLTRIDEKRRWLKQTTTLIDSFLACSKTVKPSKSDEEELFNSDAVPLDTGSIESKEDELLFDDEELDFEENPYEFQESDGHNSFKGNFLTNLICLQAKTVLDEAYKLYDPAHAELVAKSQEVGKLIDTFADN